MSKLSKCLLSLLLVSTVVFSQNEQDGIDLADSFPAITEGNVEPDLPADGFYWDSSDAGWGLSLDVQVSKQSETGYFLFGALYSYKDDGSPFWCAFSGPYNYNPDVNQWRDAKSFSNLKYGHDAPQLMAQMTVDCFSQENGTSINSGVHKEAIITESISLNLVWRTPTSLEVTAEGGETHYTKQFAYYNNLENPSLDWIMESHWAVMSNVSSFDYDLSDGKAVNLTHNFNVNTGFEPLDVSVQQNLKDFVGHQEGWEYYISTVKSSVTGVIYTDYISGERLPYEPGITAGFSNGYWIVLIHDKPNNRVMLYTVAGDKLPGELRPDAGVSVKFVADVKHDSDVLDFYAYHCEGLPGRETISGYGESCHMNELSYSTRSMADWSPRNVHRSSMKMFKLTTGGEGYLYQKNNGESHSSAENRIKNQLIDKGVLPQE